MTAAVSLAAFLRVQADVLAAQRDALDAQARILRAQADALDGGAPTVATSPRYATAKHNPLGSERGFKAACSSGAFPTFKQGRQVAARWEDVEAYLESRTLPARAPEAPPEPDPDREELARMGVRLRPANGAPRATRRRRGAK